VKKITVPLDEQREIKFTLNAMVELEERFGAALPSIFEKKEIGFRLIVAMLRVGLKAGGTVFKGTEKEQEIAVGDLVQEHWFNEGRTLADLMDKVMEAFVEAGIFPREAMEGEEGDKKEVNPTPDTDG
jgi:hypothetical protein